MKKWVCFVFAFCLFIFCAKFFDFFFSSGIFVFVREQLQLGVDESYTLLVAKNEGLSIIGEATIEVIFLFSCVCCTVNLLLNRWSRGYCHYYLFSVCFGWRHCGLKSLSAKLRGIFTKQFRHCVFKN